MGGIERNCADVVRNGGGKKPAPGPPERVDRSWQRRAEAEGGGLLLAELAELAEM